MIITEEVADRVVAFIRTNHPRSAWTISDGEILILDDDNGVTHRYSLEEVARP